ncbi:serine hydrolase [Streptomyces sp. BE20]|uniref:serine hydrolase domain-containing protein n=1 Tax=Streptomyces sp. BE20 TaxID=3002525 RepID=UPI002E79F115|nr:serine hydrolase domain-containing protein [Streptomyces sp. BE20]MEE1824592.1 serine hydrolase [Streptomyces sp. BE20]
MPGPDAVAGPDATAGPDPASRRAAGRPGPSAGTGPVDGRGGVTDARGREAADGEDSSDGPGAAQAAALVRAAAPHATAVTLAVARGDRTAVHCHGRTAVDGEPCTPDTVFELGSVTKTFTALLLAVMAERGELAPDDPMERHLPPNWQAPEVRRGGPIRLLHLATHTSGLPRLPPGLLATALPAWTANPYAGYDERLLRAGLARTTVRHRPGERYGYSNFGVGLLGRLLAETGRTGYAELLADRVSLPLGLRATTCSPDAPHRATGHRRGHPLPPWRIPGLPGAGAVRASGTDLLHYLRAHLAPDTDALGRALREVRRPRLRLPRSADRLGLVWNCRTTADGRDLLFHSGATRGFTALVGFCPQTATAVAALTNTGPSLDGRFVQAAYDSLKQLAEPTG